MELWLCTSRMAHRQVAQKVHAQKITVAKVYLAPNSLSRPWRAVVFPQPQSRVQTRTCRRKDKMIQHLTPSPLRGGLSLTSAHAVSRQAFTRCAWIALCTVWTSPGESGLYGHRAKNTATLGAFTQSACRTFRNQGEGGHGVSLRKKRLRAPRSGSKGATSAKKNVPCSMPRPRASGSHQYLQHDRSAGSQPPTPGPECSTMPGP